MTGKIYKISDHYREAEEDEPRASEPDCSDPIWSDRDVFNLGCKHLFEFARQRNWSIEVLTKRMSELNIKCPENLEELDHALKTLGWEQGFSMRS